MVNDLEKTKNIIWTWQMMRKVYVPDERLVSNRRVDILPLNF